VQQEASKPLAAYRAVFFAPGCGLLIYLLFRLNTANIFVLLLEIGWSLTWIAAAYSGHQLVRTAALWLCVTTHDRISWWELVKIRAAGEAVQFLTFTGPFLAEPAKALLLAKQGMAATHAFAAVVSEYLIYTITSATSLLSANRTAAVLNPTGLLFKMYRDHFCTIPVDISGTSPQLAPIYPSIGQQPKVNPGSSTYPLDVAAALSAGRKTLTVAVVNPTDSSRQSNLSFRGAELSGQGRLSRMTPSSLDATIVMGQKPGVEIEEQALEAPPHSVAIPPFSVSIYELALR
jgi:hypothetical protein